MRVGEIVDLHQQRQQIRNCVACVQVGEHIGMQFDIGGEAKVHAWPRVERIKPDFEIAECLRITSSDAALCPTQQQLIGASVAWILILSPALRERAR